VEGQNGDDPRSGTDVIVSIFSFNYSFLCCLALRTACYSKVSLCHHLASNVHYKSKKKIISNTT
jgi:hypothetical protein